MLGTVTIRPILTFPDPRLRDMAAPVTSFDADLRTLADDLLQTMQDASGIGMAATHIGVKQRLAVIQLTPEDDIKIYVNPEVVWASPELADYKEGSVSMQGVVEDISRPARVRVTYQDLNGTKHTEEVEGLLSVCLQHEIDQLDGIFWLQKLSRLKKDRVIKRYEKLLRMAQAS
jgi:peptide deformylase